MAKKKATSGRNRTTDDSPNEISGTATGLSKEAWIAIGTIIAALITGTVAVLTHILPKAPDSTQSTPTASGSPAVTNASPAAQTTADAIAGKMGRDCKGRQRCGLPDYPGGQKGVHDQ